MLAGLFALAVTLGTLARRWDGPVSLVRHLGGIGVAVLGAGSSVVVNNLPAATLLAAKSPPHPLPLLIGLNLGPNLLFTGSLSAYLWYKAARATGAQPSLKQSLVLDVFPGAADNDRRTRRPRARRPERALDGRARFR